MANALFLIKVVSHQSIVRTFTSHEIVPVSLTKDRLENMARMDYALAVATGEALTYIAKTHRVHRDKLTAEVMSSQVLP